MVNQTATDAWDLEPDNSKPLGDGLDVENITPEIPKDLWDSFAWRAIRRAFQVSAIKDDVFKRLKLWNKDNNPHLLEKELIQKAIWALSHFENKFRKI